MGLNYFINGKRVTPVTYDNDYLPRYEVEKLKEPTMYVLAEKDRQSDQFLKEGE